MSKCLFQKRLNALRPADPRAEEIMARIKPGENVRVEVKRVRNPAQLRLWWALCGVLSEYAEWCQGDREAASDWLKIAIGHADVITSPDGKQWVRPKSIAFGNCPQEEFDGVLNRAINVICERVIPGTSSEALRNELEAMVTPTEAA